MTPEQIAAKYAAQYPEQVRLSIYSDMLACAAEIVAQSQVVAGMEEAIRTIEAWHGTGEIWGLYQHSPEMKCINATLASLRSLANRSETAPR